LEVNDVAINQLNELVGPLVVIAIVGPQHSGKSLLLNHLVGLPDCFKVGVDLDAQTEGLWMWTGMP